MSEKKPKLELSAERRERIAEIAMMPEVTNNRAMLHSLTGFVEVQDEVHKFRLRAVLVALAGVCSGLQNGHCQDQVVRC